MTSNAARLADRQADETLDSVAGLALALTSGELKRDPRALQAMRSLAYALGHLTTAAKQIRAMQG